MPGANEQASRLMTSKLSNTIATTVQLLNVLTVVDETLPPFMQNVPHLPEAAANVP